MSTTLTSRERLEAAAHDLQSFASEIDAKGAGSAEDQAKLIQLTQAVVAAKRDHEAVKGGTSVLTDTTEYLKSLDDAPADVIRSLADVERTPDGRQANPQGKTLGQLFAESAEYKALEGRRNDDGMFRSGVPVQTQPFEAKGYNLKNLITGASDTTGGAFVVNDRYGPMTDLLGRRPLEMLDLITVSSTTSDTVEYVRQTGFNNNAAPVPEATTNVDVADYSAGGSDAGVKPESDLFFEVVSTTVKTIAHWMAITKRAAADAGQLRSIIDDFLRWGLSEELDWQILQGPGTGENFRGILATAGLESIGSAGTDIDAVVDAIRFVRWTGRRNPTAIVMHPNDWYSTGFLMAKDSNLRYLIGDPRASVDELQTLWGLKVVVTDQMTENFALVGDFRQAVLWQREGVTLTVTDSHKDWFVRNMLAILAEMRAAFGVLDPQAFVRITSI